MLRPSWVRDEGTGRGLTHRHLSTLDSATDDALRQMKTDPRLTHYKVLMLAEIADQEIISTVYRKLAQRYHPDVDSSPEAARRMAAINDAYAVLRDPEKRRLYDEWLASRRDRRAGDKLIVRPGEMPVGEAGPAVGPPSGSLIKFGRYSGWTLGQIKRTDPEFLEWLLRAPMGRGFRAEIEALLGRRTTAP